MKNWGKTVKKWSKNASILDPIYRGEIDFPNLNIPVQRGGETSAEIINIDGNCRHQRRALSITGWL